MGAEHLDIETYEDDIEKWADKYFGLHRADTPDWIFEGENSPENYEDSMVELVDDFHNESKNKWREHKRRWTRASLRLELYESLAVKAGIDRTDLPITPQAIEESIALLVEGLSRPQPKARDAEQDEFVSGLTHFCDRELEANNFDLLMGKVMYNQKTMFMGIVKISFVEGKPGPYTKDGRITFNVVDTRYFHPDPFAKGTRFEDSRYWIFAEPEDTAEVRRRFPGKGHLVKPDSEFTIKRQEKDADVRQVGDHFIGQRQRVLVKEAWIRDDRKVFVPELDEEGNEIPIEGVIQLQEGRKIQAIKGEWVPKYPNGRLIVTAGDVMLWDGPNDMPAGEPPYILFPCRISEEIFSWSDVELLGRIEDKINRLHKDMIRNARVNMNSPWIADRNCFDSPRKFNLLTQDPGLVLPITPGTRISRLPAAELPQFIFPLLAWLRGIFDDLLGVQAVMRGQLEKGSQLSADAVENLQVSSSSRLRYRARLTENSIKHLGHQLCWFVRVCYPSKMTVQTTDPSTGQKVPLAWTTPPQEMGNFEIAIEIGSGLPGSKENGAPLYLKLWNLGLVPRIVVLQALRIPNAEKINQMADAEDLRMAQLDLVRRRNKSGAAGRKTG